MALNYLNRGRVLNGLASVLSRPCLPVTFVRGRKAASELRKGDFIEHKAAHQKVAMRGGFMIVEGKNVVDGSKLEEKFRADMMVEEASVFMNRYTYDGMAEDESEYFFVGPNGKEHALTKEQLNKYSNYLLDYLDYFEENSVFQVKEMEDKIISIDTPKNVTIKIKTTAPAVKGASVNAKDKAAVLANGRTIKVPNYCESGDLITLRFPEEIFVTRQI